MSAVNAIGEGEMSDEISSYAFTAPGHPKSPYRVTSTKQNATKASITLAWEPLIETGSIPLTGYMLYLTKTGSGITTLAYDGSNNVA